jgi:hypothetical protein
MLRSYIQNICERLSPRSPVNREYDAHLKWLEFQRSKKTFNVGDYNIKASPDYITITGKTPETWGRDIRMDRDRTKATIATESRTPLFIFYLVYVAYALGFLMFFLTTGIGVATQVFILGLALVMMFTPMVLDTALPTRKFLVGTAVFYVIVFSLADYAPLSTAFEAVEGAVGKGYVEAFIIFASVFPILLKRMVSQMMISYRLKLEEGSRKFEVLTESPGAPALMDYLKGETETKAGFKLPMFFFRLSRRRMKPCFYCSDPTLTECKRCNRPVCSEHTAVLHGYKVCLDCFVDRRGKIRRNLR